MSSRYKALTILIFFCLFHYPSATFAASTITINPNTRYQTISGWEGSAQIGHNDSTYQFANHHLWADTVIDKLVNELGINRVRLGLSSGEENTTDWFAFYKQNADANRLTWKDHWYEKINDNTNPYSVDAMITANPNRTDFPGYFFTRLDDEVTEVVLPMKAKLAQRGENLYINLILTDFSSRQGNSNVFYDSNSPEYAEMMLAAFQHLKAKFGIIPDAIEITLEPENSPWSGTELGHGLYETQQRLAAFGFRPKFILPSTTNMANAIPYFNQAVTAISSHVGSANLNAYIQTHVSELAYHRYGGVSDTALSAIKSTAASYGIGTSMLEHMGSGRVDLYKDLTLGNNSAWQQFAFAYPGSTSSGGAYYRIDITNPTVPVVYMNSTAYSLRNYFYYVRAGAQRIEATSNSITSTPVAFINSPSNSVFPGNYVVVVNTSGADTLTITGLPAGTYGVNYGSDSQTNANLPDQTISTGQSLTVNIPLAGAITIFGKSGSTVPTTTPTPTLTVTPVPLPGDANGDRVVNILDYVVLNNTFGSTTDLRADFNASGNINILDYQILANNFGRSSSL